MNAPYYLLQVEKALHEMPVEQIMKASMMIRDTHYNHEKIWLVGNGGSAATAMHFANDLTKMCGMETVCLPSSIPTILAYGNDNGWNLMFANAMNHFGSGDILVAISCSGSSENIVMAAKHAKSFSGKVIGLTGVINAENNLARIAEVLISVNAPDIRIQEDIHLAVCHAIAGEVRYALQGL